MKKKKSRCLGRLPLNSDFRQAFASLIWEIRPSVPQGPAENVVLPRCLVIVQSRQRQGVFVGAVWQVDIQIHVKKNYGAL